MRLTLIALLALTAASASHADTLVDNVKGVQVDGAGRIERFTGIVVGDDGKVKRLLKGEKLKLPGGTRVVDGGGRVMLPGLIDAHGHIMGLGFMALQLDLTGTRSLAELQARLKAYAAANPGGGWILGRGWNQENWADKKFPTAADLDVVVGDRPVWLGRVDGHASIANSAAMKAAGVTAATRAPSGGQIIDGLFVDNAERLVTKAIPAPDLAMRARALAEAQRLLLSVGLTGAHDMGTSPEDWATMTRAARAGSLKVRITNYAAGVEAMRVINGGRPSGWLFGDRLRLVGVKLYSDGALGSRGAWLKAPYHDKPDTRGLPLLTAIQLNAQAGDAGRRGFQVAVHAIGDAANRMVVDGLARSGATAGDRRWRVEHAQVVDWEDLRLFRRARVIASMQPTHQTSDRVMAEARLGPDRLRGAYAWATMARLGVPLAFGSDFPVEHPNPFPGLSAAVSRQDVSGVPVGGWRPEEKVSFAAALGGFTRGAAHAGFAETRVGSLEPGKWADFIFVDRDVAAVDQKALAATRVLETWVAGKKVWSAR